MSAVAATAREGRSLVLPGPFLLERGGVLPEVRVAYRTFGALSPARDNAVLVCHALTGSHDLEAWWPALLGPGRALDPDADFVVVSNVLGSCYGTTGPTSTPPGGASPYGARFPAITVRDLARVEAALLDALGVRRLRLVVGGSLGGMQVLEFGALFPDRVDAIAPLAVSARHSAWCIAFSDAQRAALAADPRWNGGDYDPDEPPTAGLAAARRVAMVSYRSPVGLEARFGRTRADDGRFAVEAWLARHGERLVARFDANAYVTLTRAMDTHDLGRGRGTLEDALLRIEAPALVVSIDSDALYPPVEQELLARGLPRGELSRLTSPHGHDAFLIDEHLVNDAVRDFRDRLERDGVAWRPRRSS